MTKHLLTRKERNEERAQGLKTCPVCATQKPLSEYGANKGRADGRQYACRACCKLRAFAWRYGLTPEKLGALLEEQGGCCAMCEKPCEDWCVDHDHACCPGYKSCGRCVRGLLCSICNRALGHFEKVRETAESYLRRYS